MSSGDLGEVSDTFLLGLLDGFHASQMCNILDGIEIQCKGM